VVISCVIVRAHLSRFTPLGNCSIPLVFVNFQPSTLNFQPFHPRNSFPHNLLSDPHLLSPVVSIFYRNGGGGRRLQVSSTFGRVSDHGFAHISPLTATLMDLRASVANKRLTALLSPLDATLTKNGGYLLQAEAYLSSSAPSSVPYLATSLPPYFVTSSLLHFARRSRLGRMEGQRAKMEVVRPPRGVNSPRTTHHSGRTAATTSRRILLTAFS